MDIDLISFSYNNNNNVESDKVKYIQTGNWEQITDQILKENL